MNNVSLILIRCHNNFETTAVICFCIYSSTQGKN